MPAIPPREPIGDAFSGMVLQAGGHFALALTPLPDTQTIAAGHFVVRYALPYLGKPHWAIVPGLVALDYGEMLTGAAAWEFLLKRSNLHPRADVLGYRNDGQDAMVTVKTLDLAQPIYVLVYADATATQPIARVTGIITPIPTSIPPRILDYLPRYDTLTDWQAAHE